MTRDKVPDPALTRQLSDLHHAAFAGERGWSPEEISTLAASGILIHAPQARGFALIRVTVDEAELLTLAVAPEARRRGLGTCLLRKGEAAACAAGARRLFLEVAADNPAAIALYHQAGYEKQGIRRGYYSRAGVGVDAMILSRTLLLL